MSKTDAEQAKKEITMILLYLSKFKDRDRHGIGADLSWKGYDFNDLNELESQEYISQGSHRSKSVVISDDGAKFAQELMEKYLIEDWK